MGPGSLSWAEMHVTRPSAAAVRDLLIGALLALPVLVVALTLAAVVGRFVTPAPSPLPPATNVTGLVLNLISAAIIAPIGDAHVVALFDSTFEAGAQRALYSFIVLLPVGIALGWVFLARRSVYASIGLHATFNAIQVIALVAATGLS